MSRKQQIESLKKQFKYCNIALAILVVSILIASAINWIATAILVAIVLLLIAIQSSIYCRRLRLEYEEAKDNLRVNPRDISRKQAMLEAGRRYFSVKHAFQESKQDEQIIQNDLLACSGDPLDPSDRA